uniref:Uncharacterized protein n=1 Tax=Tetranychus urticae TaxID=32264 RepID=T1KNF5_TETUR
MLKPANLNSEIFGGRASIVCFLQFKVVLVWFVPRFGLFLWFIRFEMYTYRVNDPVIIRGLVRRVRCPEYEDESVKDGFYDLARRSFLSLNSRWSASCVVMCYRYPIDGRPYTIARVSVAFNGHLLTFFGASFDRAKAQDIGCRNLVLELCLNHSSMILPSCVIGYPRIGKKSSLKFLVHLFNFPPFVVLLAMSYLDGTRGVVGSGFVIGSHEGDLHWIRRVWEVYQRHHFDAHFEVLPLNRPDFLVKYGLEGLNFHLHNELPAVGQDVVTKVLADSGLPYGLYSDLMVYSCVHANLCESDEGMVYGYLMKKLASEVSGFASDFFLDLRYRYTCSGCSGGPFVKNYLTPVVHVPYGIGLHAFLSQPLYLGSEQGLRCNRINEDFFCGASIRELDCVTYANALKMLTLGVMDRKVGVENRGLWATFLLELQQQSSYTWAWGANRMFSPSPVQWLCIFALARFVY